MAEYGSNCIALLQLAKRTRVSIEVIPETAEGDIDIAALEGLLTHGRLPVLVAISHVPTSSGVCVRGRRVCTSETYSVVCAGWLAD